MTQLDPATTVRSAAPRAGPAVSRRRRRAGVRKWTARILVWGVFVAGWQLVAHQLGPKLFPGLDSVLTGGIREVVDLGYHVTLVDSLGQLLLGFAIACAVAIPLGALMGASRIWNDLLAPYAYGLYVTPREALVPLLIIVFGTDVSFRIVIVIIFSAFFPLVNTAQGVAVVINGSLSEMSRSICTPWWRYFLSILLPGALPYLVAGVRLGLGMAFNGIVIAELWTSVGVGGALNTLAGYRQLAAYFALAGMVAALAITTYALLGMLERHLRVRFGQSEVGGR
jgi:ABC-type nitrate/sulfonate/bicarbonate transport system permease component